MRGAGGPVTLNIQSFSEKSKHPFTRLDKNRPSFRVNTGGVAGWRLKPTVGVAKDPVAPIAALQGDRTPGLKRGGHFPHSSTI